MSESNTQFLVENNTAFYDEIDESAVFVTVSGHLPEKMTSFHFLENVFVL